MQIRAEGLPQAIYRTCLAGVFVFITTSTCLLAQERRAATSDISQPVQRDYRFEVASIRHTEPQGPGKYGTMQPFAPGPYHDERSRLDGLAGRAFGIKHGYQIQTLGWMNSDSAWFSINATVPEAATKDDVPTMLRHMLEDRFALKYHHETRQIDGYELVVAKPGPKLTISAGPPDKSAVRGPTIEVKGGVPQFSKDAGSGQLYYGATALWRGRNKTMQSLASDLADRLHLPVVDATRLADEYDYTLVYTPGDEMYAPGTAPLSGANDASTPLEHPMLLDALREQLGLELRPAKKIPIDVVVIDSANKEPSEN
jgi:uncharacterized protein (TIGR03435 family)